jgi:hypothetical protein
MREGEHLFGVAHIYASFNDTFVVSNVVIRMLVACRERILFECGV